MAVSRWKTLGSRYALRSPWATVRVDTCQLPDGSIKDDYYVLEYPSWVNALALTAKGEFIFVEQYRLAGDVISLELPGGVVDPDEDLVIAIKRELLEETGYSFKKATLVASLHTNPATSTNRIHTFLLEDGIKTGDTSPDPHEFLETRLLNREALNVALREQKIHQSMHVAGIFYALSVLDSR